MWPSGHRHPPISRQALTTVRPSHQGHLAIYLKTHSIPQPFSHLILSVFTGKRQAVAAPPRGYCWLQNPWRTTLLSPVSERVLIGCETVCLKWPRWLRSANHAAAWHMAWYMDNPSAYMFLQDNIGFGKPPYILATGGLEGVWCGVEWVHCGNLCIAQWLHFPAAVSSGFSWWQQISQLIPHNCWTLACIMLTINKLNAPRYALLNEVNYQ